MQWFSEPIVKCLIEFYFRSLMRADFLKRFLFKVRKTSTCICCRIRSLSFDDAFSLLYTLFSKLYDLFLPQNLFFLLVICSSFLVMHFSFCFVFLLYFVDFFVDELGLVVFSVFFYGSILLDRS